jgi:branched-chain amino acid transport system permease protein
MNNANFRRKIALISTILLFAIILPVITDVRWHLVMNLICLNAVAALSLYFIAILGMVSFAQAGFYGLGSYTVSILLLGTKIPFWIAWITGGVVAVVVAWLIGLVVLKIKGAYFFLVTLALNQFLVWIFHSWKSLTGGYTGLYGVPAPSLIDSPGKLYYLSLALLLGLFLYILSVQNSRLGPILRANHENETMIQSYGISPFRIKMTNWITCCFFTGLAGGINAILINSSYPTMFDMGTSLRWLVFLVFGGMVSPIGPIIGSGILTMVSEFLRPVKQLEPLVYGSVLLLIIILLPGGLLNLFKKLFKRSGLP